MPVSCSQFESVYPLHLKEGSMYKRVKLTCIPNLSVEYEIDTNGIIYGKGRWGNNCRPLAQNDNGKGYLNVQLATGSHATRKKHYVHRLVALQFIPNEEGKPTVNHKDGNRYNNKVSNLEWATKEEQEYHKKYVLNSTNGCTVYCKNRENDEIYKFNSILDCSKFTKNDEAKIRYALKHSGYTNGWWYSLTNKFINHAEIPRFHKRMYYAKNIETGKCIEFRTSKEIKEYFGGLGQIYDVLNGKAIQSHGYYWSREPFV